MLLSASQIDKNTRERKIVKLLIIGVANGKCETLRDRETSVFLCEPETFAFLHCETETSKCLDCERETLRLLKFEPQIWLRAMRIS